MLLCPREVFGKRWREGALGNRLRWHLSSKLPGRGASHSRHAMSKNHQLSTWTHKLLFKSQYAKSRCRDPVTMCTKCLLRTRRCAGCTPAQVCCCRSWGMRPSLSPLLPPPAWHCLECRDVLKALIILWRPPRAQARLALFFFNQEARDQGKRPLSLAGMAQ